MAYSAGDACAMVRPASAKCTAASNSARAVMETREGKQRETMDCSGVGVDSSSSVHREEEKGGGARGTERDEKTAEEEERDVGGTNDGQNEGRGRIARKEGGAANRALTREHIHTVGAHLRCSAVAVGRRGGRRGRR